MKEIIDIETRGVEHMIININDYLGGREMSLFQDSTRNFFRIGSVQPQNSSAESKAQLHDQHPFKDDQSATLRNMEYF